MGEELSLFADEMPQEDNCCMQSECDCDCAELFARLARSPFRSKFHLRATDKDYVGRIGLETLRHHAQNFVAKRLAPAIIRNDGKQTPMRGHPVFVAQHATGCCCRGCLQKWHGIEKDRALTAEEQSYVVAVLMAWIEKELGRQG